MGSGVKPLVLDEQPIGPSFAEVDVPRMRGPERDGSGSPLDPSDDHRLIHPPGDGGNAGRGT